LCSRRILSFTVRQRCETAPQPSTDTMTANLPYIRNRDGVFQYERRVPLRIQRDPAKFNDSFGGRALFRRSLRTKRRSEAVQAYDAIDREFEALVANGGAVLERVAPLRSAPKRIVTDHDLAAITERYSRLTAEPFEKLHRRANVCPVAADELARSELDLEMDSEAIRDGLRGRKPDADALILQPASEAAAFISEHGFYAPEGSEYRGAVIGAVRSGLEQGYSRIAALSHGHVAPGLGGPVSPLNKPNSLTLAEAVSRYIEARSLSSKAISEIRLALRQFEQVVGRKSVVSTTRDDIHQFVKHLSSLTVGGKSAGSVARNLSEQSIGKRLRLLSAALNHARDRGWYDGINPVADIRLRSHLRAPDKAKMPDKRRFQITELNAIFAHPMVHWL